MKIDGVTHWSIPVHDLAESERFYGHVLGLDLKGRLGGSSMSCVTAGDNSILLCETKGLTPAGPEEVRWDGAGAHHSFHMSAGEWERGVRTLAAHKTPILDLVYREGGFFPGREVYFLDPSGNVLELRDPSWKPGMARPTLSEILEGGPTPAR